MWQFSWGNQEWVRCLFICMNHHFLFPFLEDFLKTLVIEILPLSLS